MADLTQDEIGRRIASVVGLSTLPIGEVGGASGTAFLYNELVSAPGESPEQVREWLVTAGVFTRGQVPTLRLRSDAIEGDASAEASMPTQATPWERAEGVAVQTFAAHHQHAQRQGWSWRTQQVTKAMASSTEELAGLAERTPVFVLGHEAGEDRPPLLAHALLVRDGEGHAIAGRMPAGLIGAPVFAMRRLEEGYALACLGLVLPGSPTHPLAPFPAIDALIAATVAAAQAGEAAPASKRRWGRSKG